MIRASELPGGTLGVRHHRSRVVAADVEEPTQLLVLTADDHNRLAAWKLTRGIVTGRTQLIETGDILPASSKGRAELELQHAWMGIPGRGYCGGAFERRVRVVETENLFQRLVHLSVGEYSVCVVSGFSRTVQ